MNRIKISTYDPFDWLYDCDDLNGDYMVFDYKGLLHIECSYVNGVLHGIYRTFENGILQREHYYNNGALHGESRVLFGNGTISSMLYVNDMIYNCDVEKLTAEEKTYLTVKYGVQWLSAFAVKPPVLTVGI